MCVGNHLGLFESAGFTDIRRYRYWHQPSRGVDIAGMLEDLSKAPEHSVVILHACAHNPTGSDPTQEEWYKILEVVKVSSGSLSKLLEITCLSYIIRRGVSFHSLMEPTKVLSQVTQILMRGL